MGHILVISLDVFHFQFIDNSNFGLTHVITKTQNFDFLKISYIIILKLNPYKNLNQY